MEIIKDGTYVVSKGLSDDEATVWEVYGYDADGTHIVADLVAMQGEEEPEWSQQDTMERKDMVLFWLQKGDTFTANGIPYRMRLERLEYDNTRLYAIVSHVGAITTGGRNTRYPIDKSSRKEIQFL